jgi:hypothetical protein
LSTVPIVADGAEGGLAAQTQGAIEHLLSERLAAILDGLHWLSITLLAASGSFTPWVPSERLRWVDITG